MKAASRSILGAAPDRSGTLARAAGTGALFLAVLVSSSGCGDGLSGVLGEARLELTSPSGGETWDPGSTHEVSWTCNAVAKVKIQISRDGGTAWETIVARAAAAAGTYSWTVSGAGSSQCLVRVSDAVDRTPTDQSDEVFSIPGYMVISPNGGETWYCDGPPEDISWTSTGMAGNVDIRYSTDGGATWSVVQTNVPDSGSYGWTIPTDESETCRVRVQGVGGGLSDASDADFTISARPDLVVDSITHMPSGLNAGDTVTFTVTVRNSGDADAPPFNVGFWSNRAMSPVIGDAPEQDVDVVGLAAGAATALEFVLTAPADGHYAAWAYADRSGGAGSVDESDETNNAGPGGGHGWTVGGPPPLVVNEVLPGSPDWAEIYNAGSAGVDMTDWDLTVEVAGTTRGSYTFPAGFVLPAGGYVVVRENFGTDTATDLYTGFNIDWYNDGSFGSATLTDATGLGVDFVRWGTSTVTTPAGTFWTGTNPSGPVSGMTLGRDNWSTDTDDGADWENTCGVDSDVPTPGATNGPPMSVGVTSPGGGETWYQGDAETITWATSGVTGNVDVHYSTDGGATWNAIATNTADTGSCSWTVPPAASSQCLVRVREAGGGA